jgi:hypothetical protein
MLNSFIMQSPKTFFKKLQGYSPTKNDPTNVI